jgi:hypothetical protein
MGAVRQDGLADETVGRNITLTLTPAVQFSWVQFTQFSVGDSDEKFVVEEVLEVGLWRFKVWLEDFIHV